MQSRWFSHSAGRLALKRGGGGGTTGSKKGSSGGGGGGGGSRGGGSGRFDRSTPKPDASPVKILEARDRVLSRLRDRKERRQERSQPPPTKTTKAGGGRGGERSGDARQPPPQRKERDVDAKKRKAKEAREARESGRQSPAASAEDVEIVGDDVPAPAAFASGVRAARAGVARKPAAVVSSIKEIDHIPLEERPPPMTLQYIVDALRDEKALNMMVIDVSAKCTFTQTMVIVEARSGRHLRGMAERLSDEMRMRQDSDDNNYGYEVNADNDDWIVVDCGDVMVHLFSPGARRYYDLESLWILQKPLSDRSETDEVADVEDLDPLPDLDDVPGGWNPWDQVVEK